MVKLLLVSTERRRKLEWPAEVSSGLEVRAGGVKFVNEVFQTDDVHGAEAVLDDGVIRDGNALLVDLGESALVQKRADGGEARVSVCDERFNQAEHGDGSGVQLNEDSVVDLTQTEELQNLAHFRRDSHDTTNADDQSHLRFRVHVNAAFSLGLTADTNQVVLDSTVLLDVLFGTLESFILLGGLVLQLGNEGRE